ncbi:hypothetical protein Tco_1079489 [Tanacetum coccineum]|uniref:Uncharacterized protein n=1 Tax=Tanacetum coccineum TaxID=301880 RepID=A0ABQ5HTA9_9ASTR
MTTPKIRDSPTYQTYLAFATGVATPKPKRIYKKHDSPMIKTTIISLEETPLEKKSAPAKKDVSSKKPLRKQSTGVQIRDTPGVSVSKKKAPAITDKSKGIDLMSGATLLEDAQMKKVLKWSKREIHSLQPSGSDDSDEDSSDNDSDNERTKFDEDENLNLNKNDADIEEEYKEEYVRTPENYESSDDENEHVKKEEYDRIDEELYKDVNVKLKDVEHGEEGKGGAEKTDAGHDDVTQETSYDQVENDAHAFRSYTAEFEKKAQAEKKRYINLVEKSVKDIINNEVKTQLPHILPKEVYDFATHAAVSLTEFGLKKIILDKMQKSKDEDPPAGSDQGLKRRKTSKDAKPSKSPKSKESKSSSSKGTKSQPKSSSKSTKAEESVFEAADIDMPQNQGSDLDNTSEQPNVKAAPKPKEPERPPTPDSD